jgi:UDP-2-acetamido-3-amino-2,3-dideoxy-glucuronate N-acetyltransferase
MTDTDLGQVFIHETAVIDAGANIGSGTKIWHWVHVCSGAEIGPDCVLGQNVFVAGTVRMGRGVKVQNNVSIYDGVILEDDVFLGPSMVFTNVINPRAFISRKQEFKTTHVERGVTIGANATILCGVRLGAYAFVGAGSVVLKDVPDHGLVVGNPARQVGWMCRCGVRLIEKEGSLHRCPTCQEVYDLGHKGA